MEHENENILNDEYVELVEYERDYAGYISKFFYVLSIICATLGIFVILSYPLIHIIKVFCNIDKFMQTLPIGYLASVKFPDEAWLEPITMFVFGFLCLIFATRLGKWLIEKFSIASRITCFLSGGIFMFFMISKDANALLIQSLEFISILVLFIIFIPVLVTVLYYSPFRVLFIPEPKNFCKNYYGKLLGFFFKSN